MCRRVHNSQPLVPVIHSFIHSFIHFSFVPSLEHRAPFGVSVITHNYTRQDSSGRVISPSQRPLPTQDNATYKHKRQTSMPRAGFEPATPATKRRQTYAYPCQGPNPINALRPIYLTSISMLSLLRTRFPSCCRQIP
jgi:hypothetical protein